MTMSSLRSFRRCTVIAWRGFVLLLAGLVALHANRAVAQDAFDCRNTGAESAPVTTIETTLAGVPALLRVPKSITRAPIVLWHGFGPPASERALMDALPLDDVRAIKVYLGLPLFGKRLEGGTTDALVRRQSTDVASLMFEPVVVGAAHELPAVLDALRAKGCMKRGDEIGLFGFSGGGAAVLIALAERKVAVRSAVVLNASTGLSASIAAYEKATGTSYVWTDAARKLARATDAIGRTGEIAKGHPPVALLIVQGTADATLMPQRAIDLDKALEKKYAPRDRARLQLTLADGLSHNVTDAASLADVRRWTADWFTRW